MFFVLFFLVFFGLVALVIFGLGDDLDALGHEPLVENVDLVELVLGFGEDIEDVIVGDVSLRLAFGDQCLHLLGQVAGISSQIGVRFWNQLTSAPAGKAGPIAGPCSGRRL